MPKAILRLGDMNEGQIKRTKSEKLYGLWSVYKIGLPGVTINYTIPYWAIHDSNHRIKEGNFEQIEKEVYLITEEAKELGTTLMIRSATYKMKNKKVLAEVQQPHKVNQKTAEEVRRAIIEVIYENKQEVEETRMDDWRINLIVCQSIDDCYRSGMIYMDENGARICSLWGNVKAMLRDSYPYDEVLLDPSFNVIKRIPRKKERMEISKDGMWVVEPVTLEDQDRLSISRHEELLFIDHIKTMISAFPNKDLEAMWLQQSNGETLYSYLDVRDRGRFVKKTDFSGPKIVYEYLMDTKKLDGKIVVVPPKIFNDKKVANNSITFIALSNAKGAILPKQIAQTSHYMKTLREGRIPIKLPD